MEDVALYVICLNAFVAVIALLSILALMMRLLTTLFPATTERADNALTAAIVSTVTQLYPGARVSRIEAVSSKEYR